MSVIIEAITITVLEDLDRLLAQGTTVLLGWPRGQSSEPPHIMHVKERYDQPQVIQGSFAQLAWTGYKNDQEGVTLDELGDILMRQRELQLFVIR